MRGNVRGDSKRLIGSGLQNRLSRNGPCVSPDTNILDGGCSRRLRVEQAPREEPGGCVGMCKCLEIVAVSR